MSKNNVNTGHNQNKIEDRVAGGTTSERKPTRSNSADATERRRAVDDSWGIAGQKIGKMVSMTHTHTHRSLTHTQLTTCEGPPPSPSHHHRATFPSSHSTHPHPHPESPHPSPTTLGRGRQLQ